MHSGRIGIEYAPIARLREWKGNPRLISDEQYRALAESVRKYGVVEPLIVNRDYLIIGGHQRLKVLKNLGIKTVPVVKLSLSRRDFKTLNLALNRISGEWDYEKLAPILDELVPLPELKLTGFSPQEANFIVESLRFGEEDHDDREDQVPSLPGKAEARVGDLYRLGNHRLLCGDAIDPETWRRLLDGQEVSVVVMDQPYGVNIVSIHLFRQRSM
jgi:ParB-like chromosome segregation protein Spo0J